MILWWASVALGAGVRSELPVQTMILGGEELGTVAAMRASGRDVWVVLSRGARGVRLTLQDGAETSREALPQLGRQVAIDADGSVWWVDDARALMRWTPEGAAEVRVAGCDRCWTGALAAGAGPVDQPVAVGVDLVAGAAGATTPPQGRAVLVRTGKDWSLVDDRPTAIDAQCSDAEAFAVRAGGVWTSLSACDGKGTLSWIGADGTFTAELELTAAVAGPWLRASDDGEVHVVTTPNAARLRVRSWSAAGPVPVRFVDQWLPAGPPLALPRPRRTATADEPDAQLDLRLPVGFVATEVAIDAARVLVAGTLPGGDLPVLLVAPRLPTSPTGAP